MAHDEKLGPVGQRVARNLRRIRDEHRLTVQNVSDRTREIGRPLAVSVVTKSELGSRRVDTDDLVALALALDCTPSELLLTPRADDEELPFTDEVVVSRADAWRWAAGDSPLPTPDDDGRHLDLDAVAEFQGHAQPHHRDLTVREVMEVSRPGERVVRTMRAVLDEGNVSLDQLMGYLELWATTERAAEAAKAYIATKPKPKPTKKRPTGRTTKRGGR